MTSVYGNARRICVISSVNRYKDLDRLSSSHVACNSREKPESGEKFGVQFGEFEKVYKIIQETLARRCSFDL